VNGERLNGSRELKPGDCIEIGNQQIRIEAKVRTMRNHPLASTGEYIAPVEEEETPTAPRLVASPLRAEGNPIRSAPPR
jgi:ribosomal 50S subunit-recycling heat shock protein